MCPLENVLRSVVRTTQTDATDLDSGATRLQPGRHLVAGPARPFPALSDRQLVELHMHDDVRRVIDLDRLHSSQVTMKPL